MKGSKDFLRRTLTNTGLRLGHTEHTGMLPPGAVREDRIGDLSNLGSARVFVPPSRSHGRLGQGRKSGRHKALCDYGTSLNLSDKGPVMKDERGNARRV